MNSSVEPAPPQASPARTQPFGRDLSRSADTRRTSPPGRGGLNGKVSADWPVKVGSVLLPLGILVLWQATLDLGGLEQTVLPSPTAIFDGFVGLVENGMIWGYILDSCRRVGIGFLIGAVLGLLLGILLGLDRRVHALTRVILGVLQPIPPIALIPVFILWLGIGEASKIAIIVTGAFWSVLLNTEQGVRSTAPELLELSRVLQKGRWEVLSRVILPGAIPAIVTGMRLGLSRAWSCVVAAEMIAASSGLGYLIEYARTLSQPPLVFLGVGLIGLIGLVIDVVMYGVERKLVYWH